MKSFVIDKLLVVKAWEKVKANRGAAGVDNVTIADFEKNLKDNLYKIWNRMSSGSYFPAPVKVVEISKSDGNTRLLGIPTIGDRVAQMIVKMMLEPEIDSYFHSDSYGYRPGKSAHQALEKTRERCWCKNWVIDMDIKGFFDNLDHNLVIKALCKHTQSKWIVMYVRRWLEAPIQDGPVISAKREKGTPQGGVISPFLANLFMHYAFDSWMAREFPNILFERYADDIVIHAVSEVQAKFILKSVKTRMLKCGLELHPDKTKIVYCQDSKRTDSYKNTSFDFLGHTFRMRRAYGRNGVFLSFLPAISGKATKKIRADIVKWKLVSVCHLSLNEIARLINPKLRGWINYYGKFYKTELRKTINLVEQAIERWVTRKYKKLKRRKGRVKRWLAEIAKRDPQLFCHWSM